MPQHLKRFTVVTAIAYGAALAFMVFFPTPIDRPIAPLIDRAVDWAHSYGATWLSYGLIEFASNVAMFVPFGFLAAVILGKRYWWLALLLCPLGSLAIESAQFLFLPNRFASLRDVIANSAGAVVGVALARPFAHGHRHSVLS